MLVGGAGQIKLTKDARNADSTSDGLYGARTATAQVSTRIESQLILEVKKWKSHSLNSLHRMT